MKKKNNISRRNIIKTGSALFTSITILPRSVKGANDKLNMAFIGAGGKGHNPVVNINEMGENIVAFADVNWVHDKKGKGAADTFKLFPKIPKYKDFRKMLDKHGKEIDAVAISTPDHTHYYMGMYCMKAGKDVYVEKPLCHTIPQVREIAETARKLKRVTQMGNQGHSSIGTYLQEAWVKSGMLGKIKEVHCWTNRPGWPCEMTEYPPKESIPETLDWGLWLGPAKFRDYNSAFCPKKWRGWADFGCGALGDMACHVMDGSFYSLDLDYPEEIKVKISGKSELSFPYSSTIEYYFPKKGNRGPIKLTWFDGKKNLPPHPKHLEEGRTMGSTAGGQFIIGTEASIMGGSHSKPMRIIPELKMKEFYKDLPKPREVESNHWLNFINACKGKDKTNSNFEYAARLTEIVLLGVIAQRTGQGFKLDTKKRKIINNPAAQKLMDGYSPRKGWEV